MYDAALQPTGLKATQFTLLATLSRHRDLPMSRLAEFLVMDRTTLTRNLKPLMAKGLIATGEDDDRRVRRIRLTDAGEKVLEAAMPCWHVVQSQLVDKLGHARWKRLLGELGMVVETAKGS
jgi:DNA-binding MarR family transcriptional regulator